MKMSQPYHFVRLLLSVACFTTAARCITPDEFYRYGESTSDRLLPLSDDGHSPPVRLQKDFPFFDRNRRTVYVNNNGIISFSREASQYHDPVPFPVLDDIAFIAPFWADVDTSRIGRVWYRKSNDPELLIRAQNDIIAKDHRLFPNVDLNGFTPTLLFIATWDHVGYYERHTDKTNTFQCVMVTDGELSFVIFLYAAGEIQWTSGDASGGIDGLGGYPPQIGFNAGDGVRYAGPRNFIALNIDETEGNTGDKGVWIFRVDEATFNTPGECSYDGSLSLRPPYGNMLGGTSVVVSGPCFEESYEITCYFGTAEVQGVYLNIRLAICVSPMLQVAGDVRFRLQMLEKGQFIYESNSIPFYSLPFTTAYQVHFDDNDLLISGDDTINLSWTPNTVYTPIPPEDYSVNIWLYTLKDNYQWIQEVLLTYNTSNSGNATVTLPALDIHNDPIVPVAFHISTCSESGEGLYNITPGIWTSIAYFSASKPSRNQCESWESNKESRKEELESIDFLPPCYCTVQQARAPNSGMLEESMGYPFQEFFNENASTCFYTSRVEYPTNSSRQCCYDMDGRLMTGPGGGHANYFSPRTRGVPPNAAFWMHFQHDILPFLYCCKTDTSICSVFYSQRPSTPVGKPDLCQFDAPLPAWIFGDPHIVTLDGHKYTFNGKGEFTLIDTDDSYFTVQGRMIETTDVDEEVADATVFSAIVAQQGDSDRVQFETSRRGIDTFVNGEYINIGSMRTLVLKSVTIIDFEGNKVGAAFSTGAYVEVYENYGILTRLVISLPTWFQNSHTQGLLGPFNGDLSDDLLPRDHDTPLALDSTLDQIHEGLGLTWILYGPENSHFTYHIGEDWASFFEPRFSAVFHPTFPDPLSELQAQQFCDGDEFCLFDIAATGKYEIGQSTMETGEMLEQLRVISAPVTCEPRCKVGVCVANNTCNCQAGYVGSRCEKALLRDECTTNVCQNGGTCSKLGPDSICTCAPYYTGRSCEQFLPLELQCHSQLNGELLIAVCDANIPLLGIMCTLNENPLEQCSFPLEINLASLGVGDYTLTVSADGIFNTTDETSISFSVEPLELHCEKQVIGELLVVSGCNASNPLIQILYSLDGGAQEDCTFPLEIDFASHPVGSYTLHIQATDVFNLTDEDSTKYTKPKLQIQFINSSPRPGEDSLKADFVINRPEVITTCYLSGQTSKDCSLGFVSYTGLSSQGYILRVVARASNGDKDIMRRRVYTGKCCSVHLINEGVIVRGNATLIQFVGTRDVQSYSCRLDHNEHYHHCRSPTRLSGLQPGQHRYEVIPNGCDTRRKLSVTFTIK